MDSLTLDQLIIIIVDKEGYSNEEIEQARIEFNKRNDAYWTIHEVRKKWIENRLKHYEYALRNSNTLSFDINFEFFTYQFIQDFFKFLEVWHGYKSYPGYHSSEIDRICSELSEIMDNEPDFLRRCYKFSCERNYYNYLSPFALKEYDNNIIAHYIPQVGETCIISNIFRNPINNIFYFSVLSIREEKELGYVLRTIKENFMILNLKQGGRNYELHKIALVLEIKNPISQVEMIKKLQTNFYDFIYKISNFLCFIKFDLIIYDCSDNRGLWNDKEKVMERVMRIFEI